MSKILGTNKGIDLIVKENGTEMYYSQRTGKCAMSMRGIARMLDCHPQSIVNLGVKLGLGRTAEMYTQQGLQGVNFVIESELPKLLEAITKSRMKQQTKDNAQEKLNAFAQAGFRLMVLLEIAPEVVAREAIGRIQSPEVAEAIANDADVQAQLLRSHIAVNYEAKKNKLSAGRIVGENNESVGLAYSGERHLADNIQKSSLTSTQLGQAGTLNQIRKSGKEVPKEEKYEACDSIRDIQAQAFEAMNEIMARYKD